MLFVAATIFSASAQNNFVEGQIWNNNKPAKGIVINSSSNQKATTDKRGNFSIRNVQPDKDTLFIVLNQETTLEVILDNDNYFNINMRNDSIVIERDRVQVLHPAYGGTIISRRELLKSDNTNLLRAISNTIPGVQYTNDNLFIRGSKRPPLYVINGIHTFNASHIFILDVESVEVVPAPASIGRFGQEGADGVVVINLRTAGVNQK